LNGVLKKHELVLENGFDVTACYEMPKFRPFAYVVHARVEL
jgi:hypothetical protein